jgi:hypothetical protein
MAYKKFIDSHIEYPNNTTQFEITGAHQNAMIYELDSDDGIHTPYSILFQNKAIEAIVPTFNTNNTGTWLIVSTKRNIRTATAFFDTEIEVIYQHIPDDLHFYHEDLTPIRIQKQKFAKSTSMIERLQLLDKLIPNTIHVPSSSKEA